MDKDYYQKLTLAVYRVTEFFPEKEPLRFQMRELADKILAYLILANPHPENVSSKGDLLKDIQTLYGYFDLADMQKWVDSRNFAVLKREYDNIRKPIENTSILHEFAVLSNTEKTVENSFPLLVGRQEKRVQNGQNGHRQEKILEVMNGNGMVKIGELIKMFPGINRRTVLRDLDKLCQDGAAVRNGNGRGAHYLKNGIKHDMS